MALVRVRYAPSPTGAPHVGNIRTALFNWLFARHHGGSFIVRIEDTDQERLVPGALEAILEGLRWLGLDWDEGPEVGGPYGPYIQSERQGLYRQEAERLVAQGHAYRCYCSPQTLAQMREEQARRQEPPRYDRRCRELSAGERARREAAGERWVVRFQTPLAGQTPFDDLIRGQVVFDNATLDDFVLLKSDGYPTYHLANVVDDHAMRISHVMRADEWLASTPRHVLLYAALGWEPPQFAHLPMILGPDRAKLSKRHGATSILEYRDKGYLPEAMTNFMALLGWSLDDKTELLDREELTRHFSLERIGKTGAIFNLEKLDWMNGVYIRKLPPAELAQRLLPFLERPEQEGGLPEAVARPLDRAYLGRIVPLIQERLKTLAEAPALVDFFFLNLPYEPSLLLGKRLSPEAARAGLERAQVVLKGLVAFEAEALEGVLRPLAETLGLKAGDFFGLLRVAVTGRAVAPPLFQTMAALGRARCRERLEAAIKKLGPA
ncbi:MAG: glutamate--tRNA ligase [Chloroflexi bacterium]|nr:glutamate--tRNA ligase [Chloroflexota bacterium]